MDKRYEIEKLCEEIRRCKRCNLCETRRNAICGEGNIYSKVMIVAQAPGVDEDTQKKMFIGPSGKVLDELFRANDIKREELYMTNLIKCFLPKYRKPKNCEISACSMYLCEEIKILDPKVIVPLGYYATRYIFEKYELPIFSKKDLYNKVYGKLFLKKGRKILPLPHPASLLYNPSSKDDMIKKYKKIKILLKECKWYNVCPMKRFYEEGRLESFWVETFCMGDWESCVRYKMEEEGKYHPDCMLPDGSIREELC